jgi:hypothetical protein
MFNRTLHRPAHLELERRRDENQDFELNTRGVFGGRGLIDDDRLLHSIGGTTAGGDSGAVEQFQQATGAVTTTNDLFNARVCRH